MNQTLKSALFIAVAALVAATAWLMRPAISLSTPGSERGKMLIDYFDPTTAASLEIVHFDEDTSTLRDFKVEQVNRKGKVRWSIPSHDNYPADAKEQLAEAATALLDRKILYVAGSDPGDHAGFGVLDPSSKDLKPAAPAWAAWYHERQNRQKPAFGDDRQGGAGQAGPPLRPPRGPGAVYVVEVKTDKLSTKFGDWIEKNLLSMNTWDLKQVLINDYAVDLLQGSVEQSDNMTVSYDDAASRSGSWSKTRNSRVKSLCRSSWPPTRN